MNSHPVRYLSVALFAVLAILFASELLWQWWSPEKTNDDAESFQSGTQQSSLQLLLNVNFLVDPRPSKKYWLSTKTSGGQRVVFEGLFISNKASKGLFSDTTSQALFRVNKSALPDVEHLKNTFDVLPASWVQTTRKRELSF